MRLSGGIAALAAASMGSAAVAQTAGEAVECTLPYAQAMQAMAALTVTGQSKDKGFAILLGPSETMEFAPGATRIHGQTPQKLTLTVRDPAPGDSDKVYTITFKAYFPHDRAIDNAIIASNTWHFGICGDGMPLCQRGDEPEGGAKLRYYRDYNWNDAEEADLSLECEYKLRGEDIAQ